MYVAKNISGFAFFTFGFAGAAVEFAIFRSSGATGGFIGMIGGRTSDPTGRRQNP